MLTRAREAAHFPLGNDRIASSLAFMLALAPVAVPSAVLIAAGREVAAPPRVMAAVQAPANHPAKLGRRALAHLIPIATAPAERALFSSAIAGSAPIRSAELEHSPENPSDFSSETTAAASRRPAARSAASSDSHWIMQHYASVHILDGFKLEAGSQVIALAGVRPPPMGATCRRLDGVVQSCIARADSRLDVLVKGRPISCEVFVDAETGETRGRCKAGDIDLAADLLRNGLARPG